VTSRFFIKDSSFKKPENPEMNPMIMVGPGTGVVPFIGFMEDREVQKQNQPDIKFSDAHLFFGCRRSTSDYIYREEIAKQLGSGIINQVHIAFSRDDPSNRIYVQDLMRQQKELIIRIVFEQRGYLYLCGNTKMGLDV
jgi:sulfite reductase alpha subunit-like flavoprotein